MPLLNSVLSSEGLAKLEALHNSHVMNLVERYVDLCKPSKVTVNTDDKREIEYIRQLALDDKEETKLKTRGHTIHYDGYYDLARDVGNTAILLPLGQRLSRGINWKEREAGLKEITTLLDGAMKGKTCVIRFFCLGPTNSRFSISALQITDSVYVAHSEDILYRVGYEQFKKLNGSDGFFTFLHSAGELDERNCTKNTDKRRIFIDYTDKKVYSVNNQYAGNSVGLKKLALRLAIYKANQEDWLAEHMLLMGVRSERKKRVTYFTGAFPSACGKTSTAMIPGQTIVGDDIAYLREDAEGNARAVNIESGIFGIIADVNPVDDPLIYRALTTPRELIFSNVLVADGVPYWLGMGRDDIPKNGLNHSGDWSEGRRDTEGNVISLSHPNARYTMRLNELENLDPRVNDVDGVIVHGILYGGRDSDTNVPIYETLSWKHGVYIGATIESETTTATIGKTGVRTLNPMSNADFLTVPLGTYISNHIAFGTKLRNCPKVFVTNYFLKSSGKYCNQKVDKKIWLLWAEGRIHGEYEAVKTPTGCLPRYDDLRVLFRQIFNRDYSEKDYLLQFSIRVDKLLEKSVRMEEYYRSEQGLPGEFWDEHNRLKIELEALKREARVPEVPPSFFR